MSDTLRLEIRAREEPSPRGRSMKYSNPWDLMQDHPQWSALILVRVVRSVGAYNPDTNFIEEDGYFLCFDLARILTSLGTQSADETKLSSTSQGSRRLSAMKIFYVNIICGDLRTQSMA